MNQSQLFVSGPELANLVVNSGLIHHSWNALYTKINFQQQQQQQSLDLPVSWDCYKQSNCTVIAFAASPICTKHHFLQQGGDFVSSATLKEQNFPLFEFLCFKGNPSFSISRAAITLFATHFDKLSELKTQLYDSRTGRLLVDRPLIITGHSLGGSIASLFTLWLLDSLSQWPGKLPLCITFGSPLVGDKGFQRAISEHLKWNSCFLHVAANQDPVPRLFISPNNPQTTPSTTSQDTVYKPFGTYLLCSELGGTCVEDPEMVTKLLVAMSLGSTRNQVLSEEFLVEYYDRMVKHLKSRIVFRESSPLDPSVTDSLRAGIILQLEAITVEQQQNIDILIRDLEQLCMLNKRKGMSPIRKLNEVKIKMAYLEWYKKVCKDKGIGYYDSYKNQRSIVDIEVTKHKRFLTNYWKQVVEEAERKPRKEREYMRMAPAWVYAGTNYRRMVEPLDIADYYRGNRNSNRNYQSQGIRSRHYILLEQWQKEYTEKPASNLSNKKKTVRTGILTEDSCFWDNLEQALIACKLLKDATSSVTEKESWKENLIKFEQYVMTQITNYAISPEIFLGHSSFMKWWKEYQEIVEAWYSSPLTEFMNNRRYEKYEMGCFENLSNVS